MKSRSEALREQFGGIDIYLFDQIHRGRFDAARSVLDAGCGAGRNLVYFLRQGLDVFGVDRDAAAIAATRERATALVPGVDVDRFRVAEVEAIPHSDGSFDAVLCSAVLHFAEGIGHFERMLTELWRVLRPGGLLFTRLASTIGLAAPLTDLGDRRFVLPGGVQWFLVDEELLLQATRRLGGTLLDPIKTTNVQNQRCMTTWCLSKGR